MTVFFYFILEVYSKTGLILLKTLYKAIDNDIGNEYNVIVIKPV